MAKIAGGVLIVFGLALGFKLIWPILINMSNFFFLIILGGTAVVVFRLGSNMWMQSSGSGKFLGVLIVVGSLILIAKFLFGFIFSLMSLVFLGVQLFFIWLLIWVGLHWYRLGEFRFPWQEQGSYID